MIHAVSILLVATLAAGPSPPTTPRPAEAAARTVLLLRNGEVLRGPITKVGDRYVVMLGDGSELRIRVSDVEMHCLNLQEAYLRKRASCELQSANDHLVMTDWCLRNALHQRAADELLQAIALDPNHPKIPWFERRLQSAVREPAVEAHGETGEKSLVNLDQLERTMRDLPPDVVEVFVARVQPLLLNRCGANTCHGPRAETGFRLVRPGWGKTITRRFTQRNLHATLQEVDYSVPEDSRLLVAPSGPHADVPSAVFSDQDEPQLRQLVDWVRQVTAARNAAPADAPPVAQGLMQASFEEPVHLPHVKPGETGNHPRASRIDRPATGHARVPLSDVPPRDAFDPAIFNRRFANPAADAGADHKVPPTP